MNSPVAPALGYWINGRDDAPVLVLGPSLGTTTELWQPQVPALSESWRVLRYDHLGHGRSATPPGPYTIERLGLEVIALLDSLELDRVAYAGVSLAGMVGMWLAAHRPERIARLALVCTSAYLPPEQAWQDRAAQARTAGTASLIEPVVGRWFTRAFPVAARTPYAQLLAATPDEGYASCCEAIGAMDLRDDLSRIAAPTLVIAGADDQATPPAHGALIADAIVDARLVVIRDAAHLVNVEQAATVTALLAEHFAADASHI